MTPIVFDLDGTLIHSLPDIVSAVNRMLADFDKTPLSDAKIASFVGNGLPKLVERVGKETGLDHPDAFQSTLDNYDAAPSELTTLYPGVTDALETLKQRGHTLGICTNKEYELTLPILDTLNIAQYFDVVIGGNSRPTRKPDPEPLIHSFQQLGSETGIFIGDSEVDADTAHNAGVPCGIYEPGYRKGPLGDMPHTFSFDDFGKLPGHISAFGTNLAS